MLLPSFKRLSCDPSSGEWMLHGEHLDLIEGIGTPNSTGATGAMDAPLSTGALSHCDDGACLVLAELPPSHEVSVKVAWIDQPFVVKLPESDACAMKPLLSRHGEAQGS